MTDERTPTTPDLETRILFLEPLKTTLREHASAAEWLDQWRSEGFIIVTELFSAGVVYFRLERDNAAIAEQKRWDALTPAEKIAENVRGMGLA